MKTRTLLAASVTAAVTLSTSTLAGGFHLANFDDAYASLGTGPLDMQASGLGDFYADEGMRMSASETVWLGDGVSNTDFGNFDIEGTNGPAYLALYSSDPAGGTVTFAFDGPVNFLIDLITSSLGDTTDVVCTVTTMLDGKLIETEIITLPHVAGDPDGQAFFYQFSGADTYHFQLAPNSNRVLAFDYIEWANESCGAMDFNHDGALDFLDISAFIAGYTGGCVE